MTTAVRPTLTAEAVKSRLYGRHPGHGGKFPGPWTCIEEWRGIDLLAVSAWSSAGGYARIGYEVKISRTDLRRELLKPGKRAQNVAWCNEFYFALPRGLLTDEELAYEEPEWLPGDFSGPPCPGILGRPCRTRRNGARRTYVEVPMPAVSHWPRTEPIICPACNGKGVTDRSRVEVEAPTCWIPRDVGCVIVDGRGTELHRKSPRRKEVPMLNRGELGQLVRWISMRPDPRHHPAPA